MQMDAGMASHVVFLARVGKEIWLGASLDAGIEEREAVLGNDGVVVVACDNLQFAFQVLGLADEAGLGVAIGIILGRTHITLTIHHLVPFPVDDGTTCHAYLENVGIIGH